VPTEAPLKLSQVTSNINRNRIAPSKKIRALIALGFTALIAEASLATHVTLLFPSVAPSWMVVVHRPGMKGNHPFSILGAHYLGAGVALALLLVTGLYGAPSALEGGFSQARILVAAISIGATALFEENTPFYHPPAAATTLLVALGLMTSPKDLVAIAVGVAIVAGAAALYEYACPKTSPAKLKKEVSAAAATTTTSS
jgi:hypothetical protein